VARWGALLAVAVVLVTGAAAAATPRAKSGPGGVYVYWDQNEQEQLLTPAGHVGVLVPFYNPNGQLCVMPDRSGRFVTGYNPTLASQHNPGSKKPIMNPPVGEAVWGRHGAFTGKTIAVPGPYANPGSKAGGDIPPDTSAGNAFNNNGSFTGCTFDRHGNLLANDIGTAQGALPVPDNGRLIEWFAPKYTQYCVLVGPTQGGVGPHHVDGTGGLKDPGTMATAANGDVYLAESGAGRVIVFAAASIPSSAQQCGPAGVAQPAVPFTVFTQGHQAFPLGIARDPTCQCWAVSSVIGDPAVAWYDDHGQPLASRPPLPSGPYSPFGMAFTPDGTLYFVDIHLEATKHGFGPASHAGQVMKVTFANGAPRAPVPIAQGLDFPVSVTVCNPATTVCPSP
jgi:hypothetical protein